MKESQEKTEQIPEQDLNAIWLEKAKKAVLQALRDEVAERRRLGEPIYVWRDGKVVDINKKV